MNSKILKFIKNSKILKLKIIFVFPLFFVLCSMFLSEAKAQTLSLSIWPPLLEVMIQPGKSITQVYKLINEGETDLVVKGEIFAFNPLGEQGEIQLSDQHSPAHEWISFQNADLGLGQNFAVKAGQSQQIVLKIKVPLEAKEDDYYLTLLFSSSPDGLISGYLGSQARAEIGSNILLTVSENGEPPRKAEITEFKLANPSFSFFGLQIIDSFPQPQFLLRVKNTGRSLFKPMGVITVNGWLKQKYLLNLLPENILTKSTRQITCENETETKICRLPSKFLIGPYQAKVEFGLDKISSDYTARINFIALPLKMFLVVLGLIILVIIIKLVQIRFKSSLDK